MQKSTAYTPAVVDEPLGITEKQLFVITHLSPVSIEPLHAMDDDDNISCSMKSCLLFNLLFLLEVWGGGGEESWQGRLLLSVVSESVYIYWQAKAIIHPADMQMKKKQPWTREWLTAVVHAELACPLPLDPIFVNLVWAVCMQ